MLFSSLIFLFLFLPAVLIGYYFIFINTGQRNVLLLFSSLVFYAWGEPVYILLMIASICLNYFLSLKIAQARIKRRSGKLFLFAAVLCNLSILFLFKYADFAMQNLTSLFPVPYQPLNLTMPIGISFFTFQAMSYVIDVYRNDAPVQKNPLNVGLYISFFPQLVAGPIVRYNTLAWQIQHRSTSLKQFEKGASRFIIGLCKKILLANQFAVVSEKAFALNQGEGLSVTLAWLGAVCYAFQIFFDFSGYSDMAIGLGKMFGFEFEENFNYPYISRTVSEFWRRWHISLGQWFRDYVYIPLGGSRVQKRSLLFRNLLIVWLLTGIWHGASWNFIVWGLGYGLLIAFEKLTGIPERSGKFVRITYQGFTLLIILFGWVLFGSDTLTSGLRYIQKMSGLGGAPLYDGLTAFYIHENAVLLLIALLLSTPLPEKWLKRAFRSKYNKSQAITICAAFIEILLFFTAVSYLVLGFHNPFIYFNF